MPFFPASKKSEFRTYRLWLKFPAKKTLHVRLEQWHPLKRGSYTEVVVIAQTLRLLRGGIREKHRA